MKVIRHLQTSQCVKIVLVLIIYSLIQLKKKSKKVTVVLITTSIFSMGEFSLIYVSTVLITVACFHSCYPHSMDTLGLNTTRAVWNPSVQNLHAPCAHVHFLWVLL